MSYRTVVTLSKEQELFLKRLSGETGDSISGLVRNAVDILAREREFSGPEALLEGIAQIKEENREAYKAKDENLSQKVDQLVYGK